MSADCTLVRLMADGEFIAVVNDTNPANNGRSYNVTISGNNHAQFLGKRIGDVVDGIFVGEGETALNGYKLEITGGSDKTGTPMRRDLDGGSRQSVLVTASTGYKGHKLVQKTKKGEKRTFRYVPDGLRRRRNCRGCRFLLALLGLLLFGIVPALVVDVVVARRAEGWRRSCC